ncbi:hypothetical protein [Tsukamurella soli]
MTVTLTRIHIATPHAAPLITALAAAAGADPGTVRILGADGGEATLHTVTVGDLTVDVFAGDSRLAVAELTVPDLSAALDRLPVEARRRRTELGASHRVGTTIVVVRTGRTDPPADPAGATVTRILVSMPEPAGLAAALGAAAGLEVATDPITGSDGEVIHRVKVGTVTVEVMSGAPGVPALDLFVPSLGEAQERFAAARVPSQPAGAGHVVSYVGGTRLLVRSAS